MLLSFAAAQPLKRFSEAIWAPHEKAHIDRMMACAFVGSPTTISLRLQTFIAETQADELIVTGQIYDHAARLNSYRLLAEIR